MPARKTTKFQQVPANEDEFMVDDFCFPTLPQEPQPFQVTSAPLRTSTPAASSARVNALQVLSDSLVKTPTSVSSVKTLADQLKSSGKLAQKSLNVAGNSSASPKKIQQFAGSSNKPQQAANAQNKSAQQQNIQNKPLESQKLQTAPANNKNQSIITLFDEYLSSFKTPNKKSFDVQRFKSCSDVERRECARKLLKIALVEPLQAKEFAKITLNVLQLSVRPKPNQKTFITHLTEICDEKMGIFRKQHINWVELENFGVILGEMYNLEVQRLIFYNKVSIFVRF